MQSFETHFLNPTIKFPLGVFWIMRSNASGKLLRHGFEQLGNRTIVFLHGLLNPCTGYKRPLLFAESDYVFPSGYQILRSRRMDRNHSASIQ